MRTREVKGRKGEMGKWHSALAIIMAVLSCVFIQRDIVRAQVTDKTHPLGRSAVEIQAKIEDVSARQMVLEVNVRNVGAAPVYLATDPRRVDRSKGPYIETDNVDPSTLICSLQLYPPDPFETYINGTDIHLIRLALGESHKETLKLTWPMRTTEPPFSDAPGTRPVPAQSIKRIEVRIGVLPESPSLADLISRKSPPYDGFTGMEQINVGSTKRSLYEIQEVFRSNVVEIIKPPTADAASGAPAGALVHESVYADPPKPE